MEQYRIQSRLGEGAHGSVFAAARRADGVTVAIKTVLVRRPDQGMPVAAVRELRALKALRGHPNVCALFDSFVSGNCIALVTECASTDLGAVMRGAAPLGEPAAKSLFWMLGSGVAHMHGLGIVHRDLKPANLLLFAPSGRLAIADFGQARLLSDDGRPYSHRVSTRWYRAPELLFGACAYTEHVDVWAMGCILGEMLNGSPCVAAPTPPCTARRGLLRRPQAVPGRERHRPARRRVRGAGHPHASHLARRRGAARLEQDCV